MKGKTHDEEIKIHKDERSGVTNFGMKSTDSSIKNIDVSLMFSSKIPLDHPIFRLIYDSNLRKYFFKTLENSPSVIIQIKINPSSKWIINREDKFLVGDMILKFEPKEDKEIEIIRMITKRHPKKLSYLGKASEGIITIGRNKNCSFSLESNLMSRIHASVYYNDQTGLWEFKDGEMTKPSANGCFVFTANNVEILDKLEIKVNDDTILFSVEEMKKND